MKIVGTISNEEEAKEVEFVVKLLVVGNRARALAEQGKKVDVKNVL
jgi:hypothetical protein